MINPDQTRTSKRDLCGEVRRLENLWSAWHSVRARALASSDRETAQDARRIDQSPSKHIRAIHEQLRRGTFRFAKQKGALKFRKGKAPRPIVISPVRNRLVQRAILDVLQSPKPRHAKQLGELPHVLATPTSVGGIPGRGSPQAVELIRSAIRNGATYYIRSDIKEFFTRVSVPSVLQYLLVQTGDQAFVDFVESALAVELSNAEEPRVRDWMDLFPDGEVGVPQGSSLSALCANISLRDFDAQFNARSIVTVRYVDDFVMLGNSERSLRRAWAAAEKSLLALGLEAHSPFPGSTKAGYGKIQDGFDFLSFRFHGADQVSPSSAAKQTLLAAIKKTLSDARRQIDSAGTSPRRAEPRLIQTLCSVDRRVRGWGDAFKDIDQRLEFAQLDAEIMSVLQPFLRRYFGSCPSLGSPQLMRRLGIAILADTPKSDSDRKVTPTG